MLLVLSFAPILKQQFNKLVHGKGQTNRDQNLDLLFLQHNEYLKNLLKIEKKSYKDIDFYYIGYVAIKKTDDCENSYSVNTLHLIILK